MQRNDLTIPTYWEGSQWAVTGYGLETVGEPYHYYMTAAQLAEITSDGKSFAALHHISKKTWTDLHDLRLAWVAVLDHHANQFHTVPDCWEAEYAHLVDGILLNREVKRRSQKYLKASDDGLQSFSLSELDEAERKAKMEMEKDTG